MENNPLTGPLPSPVMAPSPLRQNDDRGRGSAQNDEKKERGLYKRGKIWWMRYSFNGKEIMESCKTKNKKIAGDHLASRRTKINNNDFFPEKKNDAKLNVKELAEKYLKKVSSEKPKKYRRDLTLLKHLLPYFGRVPLANVGQEQVLDYRIKRGTDRFIFKKAKKKQAEVKKAYSNAAINREVSLLVAMLEKAVAWKDLSRNEVLGYKKLTENPPRTRNLTADEVAFCAKWCAENGYAELWDKLVVYLNTGYRKKEVVTLEYPDLDFDRNTINLQAKNSKNGKPRETYMSSAVKEVLLRRRMGRNKLNPLVFPGLKNETRPCDFRGPFLKLREAAGAAGMQDFFLHDLRRTFARMALDAGADIVTIRDLLGHASTKTTENYLGTNKKKMEDAIKAVQMVQEKNRTSTVQLTSDQEKTEVDNLIKSIETTT